MATRELSSTLKNLKFMQKAIPKVEKSKEEEKVKSDDGSFGSSPALTRRCIVIMEGNPHPGALKGRMSFQSFNPSIDKLHEDAANDRQMQMCISNIEHQDRKFSDREYGFFAVRSEDSNIASPETASDLDLKRKKPEIETETESSHKSQENASGVGDGQSSSRSNRKGPFKQQKKKKHEKLDWNVLRSPKAQTKMG